MPIFLDVHKIPKLDSELEEILKQPTDEFGVKHINLFFNKEVDQLYCLLDAPDKEAVEKHHAKINVKCDWINEVKMIKK